MSQKNILNILVKLSWHKGVIKMRDGIHSKIEREFGN